MNTVELAEIYEYLKNELTPRTKGFIEKIQKEYSKEIERLNKRVVALRETIRLANNNILKDISMIKTIGMEKQEIIQRLFETSKILEGVDKE